MGASLGSQPAVDKSPFLIPEIFYYQRVDWKLEGEALRELSFHLICTFSIFADLINKGFSISDIYKNINEPLPVLK